MLRCDLNIAQTAVQRAIPVDRRATAQPVHRLHDMPALVVVTYRDDGLPRDHPARKVFGQLGSQRSVRRLTVAPLTAAGVAMLAAGSGHDPRELVRLTGGNPFLEGDANLDGSVDVSDFNAWNGNKFTSSDVVCVPEPGAGWLIVAALVGVGTRRRATPR